MARRPKPAGIDPFADLPKKIEVLERELSVQRTAMERLKQMVGTRVPQRSPQSASARKTA